MLPMEWISVNRVIDRVCKAHPDSGLTEFRRRFADELGSMFGVSRAAYAEKLAHYEAEHALIERHFRLRARGWYAPIPPASSATCDVCPHCGGTC